MSAVTTIVLIIIFVMVALFVFKQRILIATDWILKGLFLAAAVLAILALFAPPLFQYLSDSSLQTLGVKMAMKSIDQQLEAANPANIADEIVGFFDPSSGTSGSSADDHTPGYFETTVYLDIVNAVAKILRAITIGLTLIIMGIIVYLSYGTFGAQRVAYLEKEIRELRHLVETSYPYNKK